MYHSKMADDFRVWSVGQTTFYGCDNFYKFSTEYLLRDFRGGERPLSELETQMEKDIGRMPIVLNGQTPTEVRWKKDEFIEALQRILGDTWKSWNDVMYRPFCVVLSQTIMAKGMLYFQTNLDSFNYLLGEIKDSHAIHISVDPTDGTFELTWAMRANIVLTANPESPFIDTNMFTTHVVFNPRHGDVPYNGHIVYSMEQSALFDTMIQYSKSIIDEAVQRIDRPVYSITGYPATLNHPGVDTLHYFQRLADRIMSILELSRKEPALLSLNEEKYNVAQRVMAPYFEGGDPLYIVSPDNGDVSTYYLLIVKSIIEFMKYSEIVRHVKFAKNITSRGKDAYRISELLHKIDAYILLRSPNGAIPNVRFRKSLHLSLYPANVRYRMEKNAERAGTKAAQPTVMPKIHTAETLTKGERVFGEALKFLGGRTTRRTKVQDRRNRQTRHIKSRKNHTRRV